jgi:folate-binding protein YgfZ
MTAKLGHGQPDTATTLPSSCPAGLAKLPHFGLLRFAGPDAQSFLHGQLSCDVNSLEPGEAVFGSYNTPKGRMLATFLLWRDDDGYTMQLPRSIVEAIRRRLTMYVLRSKVVVQDLSDKFEFIGATGRTVLAQLAPPFDSIPGRALRLSSVPGASVLRLDEERCLMIFDREQSPHENLSATLPTLSAELWDWTNIVAGVPYITPATQDQFVPQMANLDLINGVSFSKGCYPGQEIVARMHYLGKLKQRMYLASTNEDIAEAGDKLYSPATGEQATGMVVNSAAGPDGRRAILAVMHIDSFNSGEVNLRSPAGARLIFADLPYAVPA